MLILIFIYALLCIFFITGPSETYKNMLDSKVKTFFTIIVMFMPGLLTLVYILLIKSLNLG